MEEKDGSMACLVLSPFFGFSILLFACSFPLQPVDTESEVARRFCRVLLLCLTRGTGQRKREQTKTRKTRR